jgi:FkbM family methyltransferase
MFEKFFANLFRSINTRLITAKTEAERKMLKPFFLLSIYINRWTQRHPDSDAEMIVISNFDSDLKLKIDRSRSMGASIFWTGFHEYREFLFLNKFLMPDMVAVDVGANLGEYTLFMAKRLSKGKVFSFEPMEKMLPLLNENIAINKFNNVTVLPFGLGDKNEQITIYEIEASHEGLTTAYLGGRKSKSEQKIDIKKLDDEFPLWNLNVLHFIKMDIEGGELKALLGAKKTIELYQPWVMIEINDFTYEAAGYSTLEIAGFFAQRKYFPYRVNAAGNLEPCKILPTFGNIIFKPASP